MYARKPVPTSHYRAFPIVRVCSPGISLVLVDSIAILATINIFSDNKILIIFSLFHIIDLAIVNVYECTCVFFGVNNVQTCICPRPHHCLLIFLVTSFVFSFLCMTICQGFRVVFVLMFLQALRYCLSLF